jgi:hypothetical protein
MNNHIYNNVITNIYKYPLILADEEADFGTGVKVENNYFKNNIIFNNISNYQILISNQSNIKDYYFENNLFYKSGVDKVLSIRGLTYNVAEIEAIDSNWEGNLQVDPDLDSNYKPNTTSPCVDAGAFLTTTISSGTGTTIPVHDAMYFTDGFGIIPGDIIRIGNTIAAISDINYDNNTITLTTRVSWQNRDPVSLTYQGDRPDIGFFEISSTGSSTPPNQPVNLRFVSE